MNSGPIAPVKIVLADGQERDFRLSLGALRRLREKHKIDVLKDGDKLKEMSVESLGAIIYEGLVDRTVKQEEIEDLIDIRCITSITEAFSRAMSMTNEDRPTPALEGEAPGLEASSTSGQ